MKFDENFKYSFIDKMDFDSKVLDCKNDGSKYNKYLLIFYYDNNDMKNIEVPNDTYLDKFYNIVNTYDVEEIISSCINFDSMYDYLHYYHINDFYFIKYKISDDIIKNLKLEDDSAKIKKLLDNLQNKPA